MTATARLEILERRWERVHTAMLECPLTDRYSALLKVRSRIWREMTELRFPAAVERQYAEWPNGLPAHP